LPALPSLPVLSVKRAKYSSGRWLNRFWLLNRFRRMLQTESQVPLTQLPEARNVPLLSQWEHWVFPTEETVALIRCCRKQQISISGILVAATFCGLMDCLSKPGEEVLFKWQVPFNIRKLLAGPSCPVTDQDLGCFVSTIKGLVRITERPSFWDVARSADQDLQTAIERGGPSFSYNVSSRVFDLRMAYFRLLRKPVPAAQHAKARETLLATNYGVIDLLDTYGSLHPRECTLMFRNDICGPYLAMEALVMGQRLNIGFAAHGLDPKFWERLRRVVRGYFEVAMKTGNNASKAAL
jgi:hypothetical protein